MLMLRVTYSATATALRWTACGRLAGSWVEELRSCWRNSRRAAASAHEVVDLSDVTFVDEAGEALLLEMRNAGVEFIAAGVENKHLLANLSDNANRPVRRLVAHCVSCAEAHRPEGAD